MTAYSKRCHLWKCPECSYVDLLKSNVRRHIPSFHGDDDALVPVCLNAIAQTVPIEGEERDVALMTMEHVPECYYFTRIMEKRPPMHPACFWMGTWVKEAVQMVLDKPEFVSYIKDVRTFEDILVGIFCVTSHKAPTNFDFIWRFGASNTYGLIKGLHPPEICNQGEVQRFLFDRFFPEMFSLMYEYMRENDSNETLKNVLDTWDSIVLDISTDDLMSRVSRPDFWDRLLPMITVIPVDPEQVYSEMNARM